MDLNQLSEKILLSVKKQEDHSLLIEELASKSLIELTISLQGDHQKLAFWINIYNAFFLILRREIKIGKPEIYKDKLINVASHFFSLDDIEHGILRKYRFKWALGYLPDPFASPIIKKLAVSKPDYRIHFALNCGARSCPPIAFYTPDKIDTQLELATLSFLEAETEVFSEKNEVHTSRLLLWYKGDFGGRRGIRKILKEKLQLDSGKMKLVFKAYNWEEDLNNFS